MWSQNKTSNYRIGKFLRKNIMNFIDSSMFEKLGLFVYIGLILSLRVCAIFKIFIFAFKDGISDNKYMLL